MFCVHVSPSHGVSTGHKQYQTWDGSLHFMYCNSRNLTVLLKSSIIGTYIQRSTYRIHFPPFCLIRQFNFIDYLIGMSWLSGINGVNPFFIILCRPRMCHRAGSTFTLLYFSIVRARILFRGFYFRDARLCNVHGTLAMSFCCHELSEAFGN